MRTRGSQGQQSPENLQEIAEKFGMSVAAEAERLGVKEVWNADETAVFFELLPRQTAESTGARTVWVRCAGAEKRRISVMLLGSSLGRKKEPFMVLKEVPAKGTAGEENRLLRHGFGLRVWNDIGETDFRARTFANKSGWLTGPLITEWLEMMFKDEPGPKLLLLDSFSGHWTGEVLAKCEELKITLMKIPPGCTSVSQPADVCWNRSFKAHIRKIWVNRLVHMVRNNEPFTPPTRRQVCAWVGMAWNELTCIENGFHASHIDINTDSDVEEITRAMGLVEIVGDDPQMLTDDSGNTTEEE
jgi:hypothetical protein